MKYLSHVTTVIVVSIAFLLALRWTLTELQELLNEVRIETIKAVEAQNSKELALAQCIPSNGTVAYYENIAFFCIPQDSFPVTHSDSTLP